MKRIGPGYYSTTINGVTYYVSDVGGDVKGFDGWVWYADGDRYHDIYPTKRAAVEALTHYATHPEEYR